jgi:cupin fold WbuC family metalloprotein
MIVTDATPDMKSLTSKQPFPLAMPAAKTPVTKIGIDLIKQAIELSRQSPRQRIICPFHKTESDNLQRMLNVIQPYSCIQPHRHSNPPKAESIIVVRGCIGYMTFDDLGTPNDFCVLTANTECIGVDTDPGVFHTFFAIANDTVLFEAKPGPYERSADKDFASWAPKEGTEAARAYLEGLYRVYREKESRSTTRVDPLTPTTPLDEECHSHSRWFSHLDRHLAEFLEYSLPSAQWPPVIQRSPSAATSLPNQQWPGFPVQEWKLFHLPLPRGTCSRSNRRSERADPLTSFCDRPA